MKVICDTGPLVAAVDRRDPAQQLAGALLNGLGRDALIPDPVVAEADYLVRTKIDAATARLFLRALSRGEHRTMFLTPGLLHRAVEIDARYADLDLGFTDAAVMACAERYDLPVLTFDFRDFRATAPRSGAWRLVVDEPLYREATGT